MTRAPDGRPTRLGLRRALRASTGALALCLLAAGCGGAGGDASPTGSGGATASPGASLSPTDIAPVFTLHEGFFPVPQADAKDTPWDEVGPGWFLVDAHQHYTRNPNGVDESEYPYPIPEAIGGLSLVSPDGEWYAARSFAGTGAALSLYWAADGVWLLTSAEQTMDDGVLGDVVRVDIATGAEASISTEDGEQISYGAAAGGVTLAAATSQSTPTGYVVYGPRGVTWPDCGLYVPFIELRPLISPDGTRVACWGSTPEGKTDVGVLDVGAPDAVTHLDDFQLSVGRYEHLGWLTNDTFLFERPTDDHLHDWSFSKDTTSFKVFSYDTVIRKVADFELPFALGTGEYLEAFDYATQVYISSGSPRGTIAIHNPDGAVVATVPRVGQWALSGQRLLASDWDGGLTMVDLETGDIVGAWAGGKESEVRVYGYPQHAG